MLEFEDDKNELIGVVRRTKLASISESRVLVFTMAGGLLSVSSYDPFEISRHAKLPVAK